MLDIFGANAEEDNKVVLFITINYDITLCIIAYDKNHVHDWGIKQRRLFYLKKTLYANKLLHISTQMKH